MPSTYKITTDQGVYNVTVDDSAPAAAQPASAQPVNVGGRGTGLDVRKSDEFAQGVGAAIPFAGIQTPDSPQGYGGRAVGEAALMAVPVERGVSAAVKALPSFERAAANFERVMAAAHDTPIDISAPGNAALRIQELAERGASMPQAVRKFIVRVTDPEKAALTYKEARDFYSNISRLSADEFMRLTPVMKREVGQMRAALNGSLEKAAAAVDKLPEYQSAMREYAQKARLNKVAGDVMTAAKRYVLPGGAMYYGFRKVSDLMSGGGP